MIKYTLKNPIFYIVFLALTVSVSCYATPPDGKVINKVTQIGIRSFYKINKFNLMLELTSGNSYPDSKINKVKIGTYYNMKSGEQLGIFASTETGLRHNDDWIKNPKNSIWDWKDTSERQEETFYLTYAKRFVPNFRKPLVLDLKGEYWNNFFNNQQTFVFRPGANYFILHKASPIVSFHSSFPAYLTLNTANIELYKYGFYLGSLYHLSKATKIGINFQALKEIWTESKEIIQKKNDTYSVQQVLYTTKLEIIFKL